MRRSRRVNRSRIRREIMPVIRFEDGTIVDKEDFSRVAKFSWHAHKGTSRWYAVRTIKQGGKKKMMRVTIYANEPRQTC